MDQIRLCKEEECIKRVSLLCKDLEQGNGRCPVCVLMCTSKLPLCENCFSHITHVYDGLRFSAMAAACECSSANMLPASSSMSVSSSVLISGKSVPASAANTTCCYTDTASVVYETVECPSVLSLSVPPFASCTLLKQVCCVDIDGEQQLPDTSRSAAKCKQCHVVS